jgi:hypothetical protein
MFTDGARSRSARRRKDRVAGAGAGSIARFPWCAPDGYWARGRHRDSRGVRETARLTEPGQGAHILAGVVPTTPWTSHRTRRIVSTQGPLA